MLAERAKAVEELRREQVMSALVWDGDNLFQRMGSNVEELGHLKAERYSGRVVLWLRDTRNVFGVNSGYVRGDDFATMLDAKRGAATCESAELMHRMWLAGLSKSGNAGQLVARAVLDAEEGKPLTVSTFKEEMGGETSRRGDGRC